MADPEVVQVIVQQPADIIISASVSGSETSTFAYHHVQGISAAVWEIQHGLGFFPNVTTMDSGGSMVEGELEHLSKYSLRVTFSALISGDAYLS